MLSSFCFCVYVKVVTFYYKRKVSLDLFFWGCPELSGGSGCLFPLVIELAPL
ncbi:hypothetical protein SapgrDRAFT_0401 [Saprospira grandis DSM 2844]|uniref:Uncharacterized protein n=1 Tax=Saprospira grandis DSM 2844 TaxID=694433 RepID=J0P423_9BACT|nr:hypothetical protein SapgrDRAFT_0401 [Saprospira grandis DSM 2844]